MQFTKKQKRQYKIVIDNYTLLMVTKTKFLGVWIDNLLNWQTRFDQLCLKIVRNTNLLKLSKSHLNMNTKILIYNAHIYSHLVYSCTTWGNMLNQAQNKKIQRLQNNCIHLINGKPAMRESYQSLNLLRFNEILTLQNLKLGHRVQHSQLPERILYACTSDTHGKSLEKKHSYQMRHKHEPNHPREKAIGISPASYQKASLTISHYLITLDLLKTFLDSCPHAKLTY